MTDNEIIKALECCIKSSHFGECFENECPCISEQGCRVGKETLYPYALDLINRQRAEIERLTKCRKEEVEKLMTATDKVISEAKVEAYKECIEKIYKFICDTQNWGVLHREFLENGECYWLKQKLNNLLKELVGENDETKTF